MAVPRDVIDARGSIDSRTLSEDNRISHGLKDERDRPRAALDASMSQKRWHSRAGQGFHDYSSVRGSSLNRSLNQSLGRPSSASRVLKLLVPAVIVIAIIVAIFIL